MASYFTSTLDAPPAALPAFPEDSVRRGARARFLQLRGILKPIAQWLGKTGQLQLTSWMPIASEATQVDAIVLGDSYCDDIDMGYPCWPTVLARRRSWSLLSAAKGGSRSDHWAEQYKRAEAYAEELGLRITTDTVCIVHLGGNDLLHSLWLGPLAVLLLFSDLAFIAAVRVRLLARHRRPPPFSFFGILSRRISKHIGAAAAALAARGHTRLLISGLPLCGAVPTGRAVVRLLVCGCWPGAGAVACAILTDAAAIVQVCSPAGLESPAGSRCVAIRCTRTAAHSVPPHMAGGPLRSAARAQ